MERRPLDQRSWLHVEVAVAPRLDRTADPLAAAANSGAGRTSWIRALRDHLHQYSADAAYVRLDEPAARRHALVPDRQVLSDLRAAVRGGLRDLPASRCRAGGVPARAAGAPVPRPRRLRLAAPAAAARRGAAAVRH